MRNPSSSLPAWLAVATVALAVLAGCGQDYLDSPVALSSLGGRILRDGRVERLTDCLHAAWVDAVGDLEVAHHTRRAGG